MTYSTQKQFKKKMLSSLVLASLASGAFTVIAAEGDEAAIERMTVTTQKAGSGHSGCTRDCIGF